MNHNTNTKKLNNNGFSLVELIIVVAIMAVLVGVLAPQYLQYVEKSRYQTDITMVDEVKNAIEVAIATDETLYAQATSSTGVVVNFSDTGATVASGWSTLDTEISKVVTLTDCKLTSKTCKTTAPTIEIGSNAKVTMTYPKAANETDKVTK